MSDAIIPLDTHLSIWDWVLFVIGGAISWIIALATTRRRLLDYIEANNRAIDDLSKQVRALTRRVDDLHGRPHDGTALN